MSGRCPVGTIPVMDSQSSSCRPGWQVIACLATVAIGTVLSTAAVRAQGTGAQIEVSSDDLSIQVRDLREGESVRLAGLYLEQLGPVTLELERFRVFAEDARIFRGSKPMPSPDNAYLRGAVQGFPGSLAVLGFREAGTIGGFVVLDGDYWEVSGRSGVGGLQARPSQAKAPEAPFECLAEQLESADDRPLDRGDSGVIEAEDPLFPRSGASSHTARVAIETDWEFLDLFGGDTSAATDYVGDLFAFASSIYEAEVDTSLHVSFLRLWPGTVGSDPWTANDCQNQLYEFRDHWRSEEAGLRRAIAHRRSCKRTVCGIAYVGALCTNTWGYGVSGSLGGGFDPADPLPPVWDIIVVSHEIGHNFNSPHTHCYNDIPDGSFPEAVDPCYTASGCYSGTKQLPVGCPGSGQACGTIMSYCHLLSGGYRNIAMTFGGSVLDGSSHLYGTFPDRVPERMHSYVLSKAGSGCLDPVLPSHTVAVVKSGPGTGTVASDDGGIDCGADCSEDYLQGTVVELRASPDSGSRFVSWSGDTDCVDGELTVTADVSCSAAFDLLPPVTFPLQVARLGAGAGTVTSDPVGIECGVDCTETYNEDTVVNLEAAADSDSLFAGWGGDSDCADGSLTMIGARSCTAVFDLIPPRTHTLSVIPMGSGSGVVTSNPAGISCGSTCEWSFIEATMVALMAAPAPGSIFAGWGGGLDCEDGVVELLDDQVCEARFAPWTPNVFADGFESGDGSNWSESTDY